MSFENSESNSNEKLIDDKPKALKIQKGMLNILKSGENFEVSEGAIGKQINADYEEIISKLRKYIDGKEKGSDVKAYREDIIKLYENFTKNAFNGRWKELQDAKLRCLGLNRKLKAQGMIKE